MFIEASSPRSRYDKAELWSPSVDGTSGEERCLKFWYHMYGTGIGKLTVLQYGNYVFQELLAIKGNKGTNWQYQEVTYDTSGGAKEQIVLRAERGWSNRGDIAVDDISILVGAC
ncbi:MAM domain-containing glycosylphosphatidylinositol anchor protein 1-like [Amphiura filiformis]|uniref:MAM domain-containing glycosylphosphatidylinositol anchor protein 1-like n=1 Tax=Amphiura filiformis TaxID=82378 RepID=UPI003B2223FD